LKKTFVLDTNVLLQTPFALYSFGDNDVVIPEVVLEELDKFYGIGCKCTACGKNFGRIEDKGEFKRRCKA